MEILSIHSKDFIPYGKVLGGYDTKDIVTALNEKTPLPENVEYVMSESELEMLPIASDLAENAFGGMDIQIGRCSGHNTKLNCLEYHKNSEINIVAEDFILLLAQISDMENGRLDTSKVKAFKAPAGTVIELYATTLHYAPCSAESGKGFKVAVMIPKGINGKLNAKIYRNDKSLWAVNKWLLAHADSAEAKQGAEILLDGKNIDINDMI